VVSYDAQSLIVTDSCWLFHGVSTLPFPDSRLYLVILNPSVPIVKAYCNIHEYSIPKPRLARAWQLDSIQAASHSHHAWHPIPHCEPICLGIIGQRSSNQRLRLRLPGTRPLWRWASSAKDRVGPRHEPKEEGPGHRVVPSGAGYWWCSRTLSVIFIISSVALRPHLYSF
jgi:hypothetical protein